VALDFIGGLSGGASALSGIGGLLNAFGLGKPKQKYGPTPSEAQANSLFQALLDPNNSLVKQNADINMQRGMQDMLRQLQIMSMKGARDQARGVRNPFFNPERMDENFDYMLTRSQPAIAENARKIARNDIYQIADSLKGFAELERDRNNAMYANRDRDYSEFKTAGGFGGIGGGLQDLLKALSSGGSFPWQRAGNVNPAGGFY
jgi:hypothetical protein